MSLVYEVPKLSVSAETKKGRGDRGWRRDRLETETESW